MTKLNLCGVTIFSNKCTTVNIDETSLREKSLGFSNMHTEIKKRKAKVSFCSKNLEWLKAYLI